MQDGSVCVITTVTGKTKPNKKESIPQTANDWFYRLLVESVRNILKHNRLFDKLKKVKKAALRTLADISGFFLTKKAFLITQKDGLFPLLIPTIRALFAATGIAASIARTANACKKEVMLYEWSSIWRTSAIISPI